MMMHRDGLHMSLMWSWILASDHTFYSSGRRLEKCSNVQVFMQFWSYLWEYAYSTGFWVGMTIRVLNGTSSFEEKNSHKGTNRQVSRLNKREELSRVASRILDQSSSGSPRRRGCNEKGSDGDVWRQKRVTISNRDLHQGSSP